jgi:hypothetical protein
MSAPEYVVQMLDQAQFFKQFSMAKPEARREYNS